MIELKSAREIGLMRRGGHILSEVMDRLRTSVKPGVQGLPGIPGHRVYFDQ